MLHRNANISNNFFLINKAVYANVEPSYWSVERFSKYPKTQLGSAILKIPINKRSVKLYLR